MTAALQVHPDRTTFDRLAADWPLVPVWAELLADVGTPVGLFPAIAGDGPGLLLESVERSERWGRYSFVAGDPAALLVADDAGSPATSCATFPSASPRSGCHRARRCAPPSTG